MKISVIILSGGLSNRFGEDKGLYKFKNKSLVQYSIDIAKEFTDDIIIMSANKEYEKFGYPVFKDIYPNRGPMGGIHTGLKQSKHQINLVLSCDTPFVNAKLIKHLLDEYKEEDVLISKTFNGKYQSLIGIYHSRIFDSLETHISKNYLKIIEFIKQRNSRIIELPNKTEFERCFINFNQQSEIKKYEY